MPAIAGNWHTLAVLLWEAGAIGCALAAAWLITQRDRFGSARPALIAALLVSSAWNLFAAIAGPLSLGTILLESLRNLAWLFALYRFFAIDGRHESMRPVRPMLVSVAFVELLHAAAIFLLSLRADAAAGPLGFHTFVTLRLLVVIGGLVLVHNLYGAASRQTRLLLRWPALALAGLWGYDLNYYVLAYLAGDIPIVLAALRGAIELVAAALIGFGARRGSENLRFQPSHAVTFQSLSLLVIGGYLMVMVAIAQWLALAGGDFAAQMQVGFVALATLAAVAIVPSRRLRGWLRVTLTKHLFKHRYDYRAEWLRFTRTVSQAESGAATLEERAIRALADITDSPAGLILTPNDDDRLELAARWNWPTADVPAAALDSAAVRAFEHSSYVADLDAIRANEFQARTAPVLPAWLMAEPRAWATVPLLHFDRLVGLVVLARPAHSRRLDWEDFDLLRVAGRQLASYLAENAGQEALAEATRFDEFHRRIAFVMHDIKNLASQLSLLARNAELHAENPDFRADMLVTLRNSSEKLTALLARLSRYGPASVEGLAPIRADAAAAAAVAQFRDAHPVTLIDAEPCLVEGEPHSLEQVLLHLIQNAIDASTPTSPVFVRVAVDGRQGLIEVNDAGSGMSAEFVRTRLFRPFDSTKTGGFGIGAYEARELVRAMHGRLDVESREGLGTRFSIRLPLADAPTGAGHPDPDQKVADHV